MAHVARHYRVLPLEDLVERLQRGADCPATPSPSPSTTATATTSPTPRPSWPGSGLPATIFLATGFIGTAEVPWFDRLAHGLKKSPVDAVRTPWGEELDLGGRGRAAARAGADARPTSSACPTRSGSARSTTLLGALGVTDQRAFKNLMLSWDDVHALQGLGFTIGAHTVNHPILSRVRAAARLDGDPRLADHDRVGVRARRPRAFAYPNGGAADYTDTVRRLVREAGFTCAVTTRFGLNTPNTNPWELRRGGPWEHHLPTFALKLAWYRLAPRA